MVSIKKLKSEQAETLDLAIQTRVNELLNSEVIAPLRTQVDSFLDDPYEGTALFFDDCGEFSAGLSLDLGEISVEEAEVINGVLLELLDGCGWSDEYDGETFVCMSLGEPVIFNSNSGHRDYAIYSEELGLKLESVLSEKHGYLLIEQAMRKHEIYPDIVSTDYHGNPTLLKSPFAEKTDQEIIDLLDLIEIAGGN